MRALNALLCVAALSCCSAFAVAQDRPLDSLWRVAELVMRNNDPATAAPIYREEIARFYHGEATEPELQIGDAFAGLALCAALSHDTAGTKRYVDSAAAHHYWLFNLYRVHDGVRGVLGMAYVDSLERAWRPRIAAIMASAPAQGAIVVRPSHLRPDSAIIVALHGGYSSPRQFALRWRDVAESLGVTVVVPPGVIRASPEAYSWNQDIGPIDSSFERLFDTLEVHDIFHGQPVYVAGFSQGGHAALALALLHPRRVRGAVVMEGFSGPEVDSLNLSRAISNGAAIYCVIGDYGVTQFADAIERTEQRCKEDGIAFTVEEERGLLHILPPDLTDVMRRGTEWIDVQHQFRGAGPLGSTIESR